MKYFFAILFLSGAINEMHSQNTKQNLLSSIKSSDAVESRCLGFGCRPSLLFLQQDSLMQLSTEDEIIRYLQDSSYVVKYYAFNGLLGINDSLAFNYLTENILDSTMVSYFMMDVMGGEQFNVFIFEDYVHFIHLKYENGYSGSFNGKIYSFPPPDKKKYRRKCREVKILLRNTDNVDLDLFKNS